MRHVDAPRSERLTRTALVDHLLVELADALAIGEEHAEQPTIGDRPARCHRQTLRPVAGAQRVVGAVPHQPRAQLGELLGRVAPGEHLQRVAQQLVGELGERRRAPHHRRDVGDGDLATGGDVGHNLLGEHIERVAQEAGVLDLALDHPPGDDRRLEEVAAVLRIDRPPTRLTDLMAGATDSLEPAGHGAGRLDLDHEVDGTHVDAQLEAARGNDGAEVAALELVLDDDALFASERSMMGLDQVAPRFAGLGIDMDVLFGGKLVELGGEPLGLPAGVAEHDRRAVGEDLLEDARVDRRPDARAAGDDGDRRRPAVGQQLGGRRRTTEVGHVLDGDDDVDLQRFGDPRVDDGDVARRARGRPAAEEAGNLGEWTLRRRQSDALRWPGRDLLETLQRDGEVSPAFGGGEGVDLVDDDGLDVGERVGGVRRQHEVEALGRRDQQVWRAPQHRLALACRRVPGAHSDVGEVQPAGRRPGILIGGEPLGGEGDSRERGT